MSTEPAVGPWTAAAIFASRERAVRAQIAADIRQVAKAQGLQPFERSQLAFWQQAQATFRAAADIAENGPDDYLPAQIDGGVR